MSVDSSQYLAIAVALAILHTPIVPSHPHPEAGPELTIASAMGVGEDGSSQFTPAKEYPKIIHYRPNENVRRKDKFGVAS